jgi:hypothetical protein
LPPPAVDVVTNVASVACGGRHTCVILSNTTGVRCWGSSGSGQVGIGTIITSVTRPNPTDLLLGASMLSLGFDRTCVLLGASGTVTCWGSLTSPSNSSVSVSSPPSCAVGTWPSGAGCANCPAGTYGSTHELIAYPTCSTCGAGTYSAALGATHNLCEICPAGFMTTSPAQCTECVAGKYNNVPGSSSCSLCPLGYWSNSTGAVSVDQCKPCPLGYYGPDPGLSSILQCSMCGPGKYADTLAAKTCKSCPPGTWSASLGLTAVTNCTPAAPRVVPDIGTPQLVPQQTALAEVAHRERTALSIPRPVSPTARCAPMGAGRVS